MACGVPLACARLAAHGASRGCEPPTGRALEYSLVDASLGAHALPSPWEWRATEAAWKARAVALACVADAARVSLLHGALQPRLEEALASPLDDAATRAALGVAAVACVATLVAAAPPALGAALDAASPDRDRDGRVDDGLGAELRAADLFSKNAAAFFASTTDDAAEAREQATVVRRVAHEWRTAFDTHPDQIGVTVLRASLESSAAAIAAATGGLPAAWLANLLATLALAAWPDQDRNVATLRPTEDKDPLS